MSEIYFAPTTKAQLISVLELQERFAAAGLPCTIEKDTPETQWLLFKPMKSTMYASVAEGYVTLATLSFVSTDQADVIDKVENVMTAIGFSANEDADYA